MIEFTLTFRLRDNLVHTIHRKLIKGQNWLKGANPIETQITSISFHSSAATDHNIINPSIALALALALAPAPAPAATTWKKATRDLFLSLVKQINQNAPTISLQIELWTCSRYSNIMVFFIILEILN